MMSEVRRKTKPSYKRCAFTGNRPEKMPFGMNENDPACVAFKARIKDEIERLIGQGFAHFMSGGSLGLDLFAAEAVLELRVKYPWILLEMVSPFDAQSAKWEEEYQMRHDRLFGSADIVTATSHEYTKGCIFKRNYYLVSNADLLMVAHNGQPGGTAKTIEYATLLGVPVKHISPSACLSRTA